MELLEILTATPELVYSLESWTYFSNGALHDITIFVYEGRLVKVSEALKLKSKGLKIKELTHIGIKLNFGTNYSLLSLYSSQPEFFYWDKMKIENVRLTKNFFKYANHPIIALNSSISEYMIITDKFENFPSFAKNKDPALFTDQQWINYLNDQSLQAIHHLWEQTDFNENPILLNDYIQNYILNVEKDSSPIIYYYRPQFAYYMTKGNSEEVEKFIKTLHQEINNSDITSFHENLRKNCDSKGISLQNPDHLTF